MNVLIKPRRFSSVVRIPASKSHTIRQLLIASLADGVSEIHHPLDSLDTRSCISACKAFGAEISEQYETDLSGSKTLVSLSVKGNNGFKNNSSSLLSSKLIDVGNSGTTLYLALAIAGLQKEPIKFTGDEQIQKRSAAPLLDALAGLGVQCDSSAAPDGSKGCVPITIKGPWKGGKVILLCPTSQYLSALLIAAPLAPSETITEIEVPLLNEKPYIDMTLSYLTAYKIPFEAADDYSYFRIPGGSSWNEFSGSVPGDFSSAAFPAAAAAISGGEVTLQGLDPNDTQGDKYFFEILRQMGCEVKMVPHMVPGTISVTGKPLRGGTFDLNKTPDLLPAAAAVAAFADGDTALVNVAHTRIKETDRIAVMAKELAKLGVKCTEKPDALIIHGKGSQEWGAGSREKGAGKERILIDGHGDHRIVMAFAAAALGCSVPLEITTAECADVTYPGFLRILNG